MYFIKFWCVFGFFFVEIIVFGILVDMGVEVEEGSIFGFFVKLFIMVLILCLLKKFYDFNVNIDDVLVENKEIFKVNVELFF